MSEEDKEKQGAIKNIINILFAIILLLGWWTGVSALTIWLFERLGWW